jgi:hypothetical protein
MKRKHFSVFHWKDVSVFNRTHQIAAIIEYTSYGCHQISK